MAAVFTDSFNAYNDFLLKWSSGAADFNTDPAFIRTGTQSLFPQAEAFANLARLNFGTRITMIVGFACYVTATAGEQICKWINVPDEDELGIIRIEGDGAVSLLIQSNPTPLATSLPGAVSANEFFYMEIKATFESVGGSCEIRVNGATVLTFTGQMAFPGFSGVQSFILLGAAEPDIFFNDLYILDDTGLVNNNFLGAVQVFAILPVANETPLDWTPLAGTNFSEVNQAPPPGDAAYVFAGTVGNTDQYRYTITGPTEAFEIKFVQHSLCCRLDAAGSHTIASQVNSHTSGPPLVGTGGVGADYAYAIFPYDVNPNTGVPFLPTDFLTTFFGPTITS